MFDFLKKKQFGTGYIPEKETGKEFRAEEVFRALPPVVWTEKKQSDWKRYFPIRNQTVTSSCVGHTLATVLGVENFIEESKFVVLSPRSIYARGFAPGGGMVYSDALKIAYEMGSAPEQLMPSEGKTEEQIRDLTDEKESDRIIGKVYRGGNYVYLPLDIDAISAILNTGKAVCLGVRFNPSGFTPEVKLDANGVYGHAITGVDFTLWKGEKAIVFQNSWGEGWGFGGLGIITESEMKKGLVVAAYFQDLKNEKSSDRPNLQIKVANLTTGMQSPEVMKLQLMLQYLGFFPSNIDTTGFYGGISRKAVKDYQGSIGLPQTGIADSETIKKLNSKFS